MEYLNKNDLKNILIVDDSSTARMIIKRCLEIIGFNTDEINFYYAGEGSEAIDILEKHKVDLIISDLNMPGMDGYTFIRKIKINKQSSNIPILITSSMGDSLMVEELTKIGINWNWIIKKPVVPKKITKLFKD